MFVNLTPIIQNIKSLVHLPINWKIVLYHHFPVTQTKSYPLKIKNMKEIKIFINDLITYNGKIEIFFNGAKLPNLFNQKSDPWFLGRTKSWLNHDNLPLFLRLIQIAIGGSFLGLQILMFKNRWEGIRGFLYLLNCL